MTQSIDVLELPEPTEFVNLEPLEEDLERPFTYDENALNLVPEFMAHPEGEEELDKVYAYVADAFKAGWEASTKYRERFAKDLRIFMGDLPPKEWPHAHVANIHIPIMYENLSRIHARIKGELFGDWSNVFGVQSLGPDDDVIAKVLSEHGNWQLRNKIPGFKRQMSRAILAFLVIGDFTCYSHYDEARQCNVHEVQTPDTFVTPFSYSSATLDYSDLPWYACILHRQKYELQAMRESWSNVDKVIGAGAKFDDDPEQPAAERQARTTGEDIDDDTKAAPYKLILWEGWLSLPNQDRDRFCQVVFHENTRSILFLTIHEEEDWQDAKRFQRQAKELEGYQMALAQHQMALGAAATAKEGIAAAFEVGAIPDQLADDSIEDVNQMTPPEPMAPEWTAGGTKTEPDPVRKVPIRMFTHGVCTEPLVGNKGCGYGRSQADFNRAANVALSQYCDSATNANVKSFIVAPSVEFEEQNPTVEPGKMLRVKSMGAPDLKANIMPLEFGPANSQLRELADMCYERAQTSIQAPNVLSGEPGKSGETYRGLSARIEQATKQLSVVTRDFADAFEEILRKNAALNARFLPDEEIFEIQNHDMEAVQLLQQFMAAMPQNINGVIGTGLARASRGMYERDYRVEIRADLRFATQAQRIGEADELVQMAQHPMLQQNLAFNYAAQVQALKARGLDHMIPLLGSRPPTPKMYGEQQIMQMAQQMAQQMVEQQMQQAQGGAPPGAPPAEGAAA